MVKRIAVQDFGLQFRGNDVKNVIDTNEGNLLEVKQTPSHSLKFTYVVNGTEKKTLKIQLDFMTQVSLGQSKSILLIEYNRKGTNQVRVESQGTSGLENIYTWLMESSAKFKIGKISFSHISDADLPPLHGGRKSTIKHSASLTQAVSPNRALSGSKRGVEDRDERGAEFEKLKTKKAKASDNVRVDWTKPSLPSSKALRQYGARPRKAASSANSMRYPTLRIESVTRPSPLRTQQISPTQKASSVASPKPSSLNAPFKSPVQVLTPSKPHQTKVGTLNFTKTPPSISASSESRSSTSKLPREDSGASTPQRESKLATVGERRHSITSSSVFFSIRKSSQKGKIASSSPLKQSPVFGSSSSEPTRSFEQGSSIGGLKNRENQCYANAVLQVLIRLDAFISKALDVAESRLASSAQESNENKSINNSDEEPMLMEIDDSGDHPKEKVPPDALICMKKLRALRNYVRGGEEAIKRRESEPDRSITQFDVRDIRIAVSKLDSDNASRFASCEQQDAHEFVSYLLNMVELVAPAVVHSSFESKFEERVSCNHCDYESKTVASYLNVPLDLSVGADRVTSRGKAISTLTIDSEAPPMKVEELLENYLGDVHVNDFKCSACEKTGATKHTNVLRTAPILALQLHRFVWGEETKNNLKVNPQLRIVFAGDTYRLRGMVLHKGQRSDSGHYTAATYDLNAGKWTCYDDLNVKRDLSHRDFAMTKAVLQNVYLMFYEREDVAS